jgi:GntR family transcriptional regulator
VTFDRSTRPGALPLYLQVSEYLAREVAAGRPAPGARLPPERRLAADLGVAVGTLRQALDDLADKGLIDRRRGSGTYVREGAAKAGVYALLGLELKDGGGLPSAEILSVARLPKPAHLPAFGTMPEGHRIRRLRRLSGQVAAVEEIWLDGAFAETLTPDDLSDSLYLTYRTRLGLVIARAEDRVGQAPAPDWSPSAFPHLPGTPLPHVIRRAFTAGGLCAEVSETWIDPDTAAYVARLS